MTTATYPIPAPKLTTTSRLVNGKWQESKHSIYSLRDLAAFSDLPCWDVLETVWELECHVEHPDYGCRKWTDLDELREWLRQPVSGRSVKDLEIVFADVAWETIAEMLVEQRS